MKYKRKGIIQEEYNVPVGISNFEKIRQDGYYYVDKTGLIKDMLKNKIPEVTLITRPRRFGKLWQ